jgi:hypothetical protein
MTIARARHLMDLARIELNDVEGCDDAVEILSGLIDDADKAMRRLKETT